MTTQIRLQQPQQLARKSISEYGFSLIEVMIVVAIIGIISAIAVPAYSDYVTRARVPEATAALATKRMQMEQYFLDNRKYATTAPACATDTTTSKNFTFSCTAATDTTYTLQALGTGSMTGFTYTINQANVRATPATKWGPDSMTCWITKKDGSC
jgi:type IV pilus assembly protein PilE